MLSLQVGRFLEQPAMSLLSLLSAIGGILGLCLGISVLSLFDGFEWMLLTLYKRVVQKTQS